MSTRYSLLATRCSKSGFSLLELLIYMALLAGVMVAIVGIFLSINTGRGKAEAQAEVNSNLRFAIDKIESDLRSATAIVGPSTAGISSNILELTTASGTIRYCVASSTLWRFNPPGGTLSSWSNTTALPTLTQSHSAVVYNGYIYVTGGGSPSTTSTVRFAPINSTGSIGAWTNTTALPAAIDSQSAVLSNGYIYVTGGRNGAAITSTVSYAPINSTGSIGAWTNTTALPTSTYYHSAVVYNGYIYVTGGTASGTITSTVSYAPINSTGSIGAWTNTTALPAAIYGHSAVLNNGYIYVTGGNISSATYTSTVSYAPINSTGSIGAWTNTTALPAAITGHSAVLNNGYIYVMAGWNGASVSTVRFAPINSTGSIGAWTNTTALPAAIDSQSAVLNNGYIYVTGGSNSNGGGVTSTITYTPVFCGGDAITASTVNVSGATFKRLENTNTVLGKTVVSIQVDLTMSFAGTGPEEQYSEEKITTVALRN